MEFGRLDNVDNVDFSLPKDAIDTKVYWGGKRHPNLQVHIAAPSWGIKTWVGKIYPKGAKADTFLSHYGNQFTAIEHNGTRYSIPSEEQFVAWASQVPDGFKFSVKFPELITHRKQLNGCEDYTRDFITGLNSMGDKVGTCLLLVHPNISTKHMGKLTSYLDLVAGQVPIALELRHKSWYEDPEAMEQLSKVLEDRNMSLVITDVAGRRDVMHMRPTNNEMFIRWTGNELHNSDYKRLDAWAVRLHDWIEAGVERIYFYIHQPEKTLCPESCDLLTDKLNKLATLSLKRINFN